MGEFFVVLQMAKSPFAKGGNGTGRKFFMIDGSKQSRYSLPPLKKGGRGDLYGLSGNAVSVRYLKTKNL